VMLEEIREQGVAQRGRNRFSLTPGKTSSIGAPVFANGRVVGAIDLVYFSVAYKSEDALRRYGDEVKRCAAEISRSLSITAAGDFTPARLSSVG